MPKGIPNKRYTPEFKKLVIETMKEEKLILILDKKISSAAQGYWCKTRQPNAAILYVWQVTITQYCANRPS